MCLYYIIQFYTYLVLSNIWFYFNLVFNFHILGQKGDDELAIQIMYLLYQLMCHPITGDYIIQNTGTVLFYFFN